VLIYLANATKKLEPEIIRLELGTVFPEKEGYIMQTLAEAWIQEGEERGEQKGAAKLTLRQLYRKFGIFEAELQERIRSLAIEQLENLGDALIDFKMKDELLAWLQINASENPMSPNEAEQEGRR
jgi:predicted transposase YdaD